MKITVCACRSRAFIKKAEVAKVASLARKAGCEVEVVDDLCEMCEEGASQLHSIGQGTIVACHERAVRWLMSWAGDDDVKCLSLRDKTTDDVLDALGLSAAETSDAEVDEWLERIYDMPVKQGQDAWYPVIDKERCIRCGKCHEFCPFGVYEKAEGEISVRHPHNCKNNCPACARMCPAVAIIFPKYGQSPINGGEELQEKVGGMDAREMQAQALRERLASRRKSIMR